MSFFTKKNFLYKLIACVCIFLVLINFASPQRAYAAKEDSGVGGVLVNPICKLLCALGDAIMNIIQKSVMGTNATETFDNSDEAWYEKVWTALVVIGAIIAICVVISLIPGGWAFVGAALATVGKFLLAKGIQTLLIYGTACLVVGAGTVNQCIASVAAVAGDALSDTVVLPTFNIGPQEIFSGKILLFDANIFNPKQVFVEYQNGDDTAATYETTLEKWKKMSDQPYHATGYYYIEDGEKIYTSTNNAAQELKDIIAKWYYIIRNIALVGAMITLLYIGIRMMITSLAAEKAKYKQMLSDWVIAICLIVLMHYIMIFAHSFVESITKIFNNTANNGMYIAVINEPGDNLKKAIKDLEKDGVTYLSEDEKNITWPTNMMGMYRVQAQQYKDNMEHVGYTLAYLTLVIFTLAFSFSYIKRLLYLLFLTVISPFVALTYPLDKIHDGKAQAFDMWMREYIFNLLIQPFHLLLYTIFVTMAFELASTNVIYSLVVLGFMIPAEKFLRTMFGFNKASTPGLLAGPAGAALTMSAIGSLRKFASGGHGGHGADGKGQGKEEKNNLRTNDSGYTRDALISDLANQGENGNSENNTNNGDNANNLNNEQERQRLDSERSVLDETEAEEAAREQREQQQLDIRQQELPQIESESEPDELELEPDDTQRNQTLRERISNTRPVRFVGNVRDKIETTRDRAIDKINENPRAKKFLRGAGATAKVGWKLAKPALGNAAKFTANVATGAALGGIGIASGIASGDINSVTKNAALGATTGVALSNGITNRVVNDMRNSVNKVDSTVTDWQKEYYGKEYEQKMRDKLDNQFVNDREIRKLYKQKLELKSEKEVDDVMEDALKYRRYGINDNSVIIKAMKADNGDASNRAERTSNKRIAAAMFAENSKNEKDLESNMKRFGEKKGITTQQVDDMKKLVRTINNM